VIFFAIYYILTAVRMHILKKEFLKTFLDRFRWVILYTLFIRYS